MYNRVPWTTVSLLTKASKLNHPGWSIPAIKTCPEGPCNKYCYGRKGRFTLPTVKNAQMKRYEWTKKCELYDVGFPYSREQWVNYMTSAIAPYHYFRWHITGDIYSPKYANMIYNVCYNLQGTKFWLPTRAWRHPEILQWLEVIAQLDNVTVRPSADPGQIPWVISGLHAGTTINNPDIWQCPANKTGHCGNCVVCYEDKTREVSYKLK